MRALMAQATEIGEQLKAAKQTVAVAESSSGGLVSAALLSVPGASPRSTRSSPASPSARRSGRAPCPAVSGGCSHSAAA